MPERLRSYSSIALALVLLLTASFLARAALGQTPDGSTDGLQCPKDDLVLTADVGFGGDAPGGSRSAREGLKSFFDAQYGQRFPEEAFEHRGESQAPAGEDEATPEEFEISEDGDLQAVAWVEHTGDSWHLEGFAACNSYLERMAAGGTQ